jgi:hypothetical protein
MVCAVTWLVTVKAQVASYDEFSWFRSLQALPTPWEQVHHRQPHAVLTSVARQQDGSVQLHTNCRSASLLDIKAIDRYVRSVWIPAASLGLVPLLRPLLRLGGSNLYIDTTSRPQTVASPGGWIVHIDQILPVEAVRLMSNIRF